MSKIKVLAIDDDSNALKIIQTALNGDFEFNSCSDSQESITKAKEITPDIILLDIEMPEMNGFDVCKGLKEERELTHTPILFISSASDTHTRLKGYSSGGSDFIAKPFEKEELHAKVKALGELHQLEVTLAKNAEEAQKAAFTAMKGTSELGMSISFIEQTFGLRTIEELAECFLNNMSQLGLNASIMMQTAKGQRFFNVHKTETPDLEKQVMETLHQDGRRFIDFGQRTQINYSHVALLVKNMPIDCAEAYGRYKDFLPSMLGSTNAKLISIETEGALQEQTQNLVSSFEHVRETLVSIGNQLTTNQEQVVTLLEAMLNDLDERIPRLGLDDDQENYLITRVDTTVVESQRILRETDESKLAFDSVTKLLDHIVERQNAMLIELDIDKEKSTEYFAKEISSGSDIELF